LYKRPVNGLVTFGTRLARLLSKEPIVQISKSQLLAVIFVSAALCGPATAQEAAAATDAKKGEDLVNSPKAVLAARYVCHADVDGCPAKAAAEAIDKTSKTDLGSEPLLDGSRADTPFAIAVRQLVEAAAKRDAGGLGSVQHIAVHLLRRDGDKNKDRWLLATKASGGFRLEHPRRLPGVKRMGVLYLHMDFELDPGQKAEELHGPHQYRAIVTAKLPINVQHLMAAFRLATLPKAQSAALSPEKPAALGYGVLEKMDVPSDVVIFGVDASKPAMLGKEVELDNEGKYWWDVSVAVPANKLTLIEFSETNGVYAPRTINKQSIFAAVNIYPIPVDLKEGNLRWIMPRILLGLGLTGRPGESFLLGGGWGIKELQFFAGSSFAARRVPLAGVPNQFDQRYASRFSFGLNVPVFDVLKKMTKK
jgi:hypothetical protein